MAEEKVDFAQIEKDAGDRQRKDAEERAKAEQEAYIRACQATAQQNK